MALKITSIPLDNKIFDLSALLANAQNFNVGERPLIGSKTKAKLDSMKFLSDTALHNPFVKPSIEEIENNISTYTIALLRR